MLTLVTNKKGEEFRWKRQAIVYFLLAICMPCGTIGFTSTFRGSCWLKKVEETQTKKQKRYTNR
jgi:hypothetical protein